MFHGHGTTTSITITYLNLKLKTTTTNKILIFRLIRHKLAIKKVILENEMVLILKEIYINLDLALAIGILQLTSKIVKYITYAF